MKILKTVLIFLPLSLLFCLHASASVYFDAWDSYRSLSDRNISTKIVNQDFNITIASLDENGANYQEFNGTVCVTIDNDISKILFLDQNTSTKSFIVIKAIKKMRVHLAWKKDVDESCPLTDEDNSMDSSDNFAIRPEKFGIVLPVEIVRAGDNFVIDFNATDINGLNAKDYNETGNSSFKIKYKDKNVFCKTGVLDVSGVNFADGNVSIETNYSEVGELNIAIQEINGKEFAKVDENDTNDNVRLITPYNANITILPHHFEVNATLKNRDNNFTYLSQDLNMSAILDINITAKNKQNSTTGNYSSSCYAKDTNYSISYKPTTIDGLSKILYYDTNTSSINETDLNTSIFFDKNRSIFAIGDDNGSAHIELWINFDRNRSREISPFDFNIKDIAVMDRNDTNGSTSVDRNATFYYGRVKTEDVETNKKSIEHSLNIEVYSDLSLSGFHENSLNWYGMRDDNITKFFDFLPKENFSMDINKAGIADINSTQSISGGVVDVEIANNWSKTDSAYIHVKIPKYLWYSRYNSYDDNSSSDCGSHPCFKYDYVLDRNSMGIKSGDFNGTDIGKDYNASKVSKRGVKVFR